MLFCCSSLGMPNKANMMRCSSSFLLLLLSLPSATVAFDHHYPIIPRSLTTPSLHFLDGVMTTTSTTTSTTGTTTTTTTATIAPTLISFDGDIDLIKKLAYERAMAHRPSSSPSQTAIHATQLSPAPSSSPSVFNASTTVHGDGAPSTPDELYPSPYPPTTTTRPTLSLSPTASTLLSSPSSVEPTSSENTHSPTVTYQPTSTEIPTSFPTSSIHPTTVTDLPTSSTDSPAPSQHGTIPSANLLLTSDVPSIAPSTVQFGETQLTITPTRSLAPSVSHAPVPIPNLCSNASLNHLEILTWTYEMEIAQEADVQVVIGEIEEHVQEKIIPLLLDCYNRTNAYLHLVGVDCTLPQDTPSTTLTCIPQQSPLNNCTIVNGYCRLFSSVFNTGGEAIVMAKQAIQYAVSQPDFPSRVDAGLIRIEYLDHNNTDANSGTNTASGATGSAGTKSTTITGGTTGIATISVLLVAIGGAATVVFVGSVYYWRRDATSSSSSVDGNGSITHEGDATAAAGSTTMFNESNDSSQIAPASPLLELLPLSSSMYRFNDSGLSIVSERHRSANGSAMSPVMEDHTEGSETPRTASSGAEGIEVDLDNLILHPNDTTNMIDESILVSEGGFTTDADQDESINDGSSFEIPRDLYYKKSNMGGGGYLATTNYIINHSNNNNTNNSTGIGGPLRVLGARQRMGKEVTRNMDVSDLSDNSTVDENSSSSMACASNYSDVEAPPTMNDNRPRTYGASGSFLTNTNTTTTTTGGGKGIGSPSKNNTKSNANQLIHDEEDEQVLLFTCIKQVGPDAV